ncbi:MAG: NAD-dependent epimerase/dehydratase family protein [Verrucomicrobiota bacterium]
MPPTILPPAQPLRLLILGGGAVVSDLYLPALARMGWKTGVEVTDLSPVSLERVRSMHPWVRTHVAGFEEAMKDAVLRKCFDGVIVALPNYLHVQAVQAALHAGLPVLCEKPLTLNPEECLLLGGQAVELGVPLVVGMVRRYSAANQAACKALESGLIGELREVHVDHGGPYAWTSATGAFFRRENGGILSDLGVHHLDWIATLAGPLKPVAYEDDEAGGVEMSCDYRLKGADDVTVRMQLSHRFKRPDVTVLRGAKGSILVRKSDFESCEWRDAAGELRGVLKAEQPFDQKGWPVDFVSCFAQQFLDFQKRIMGGAADMASAEDAAHVMQLIDQAYTQRAKRGQAEGSERPGLPSGRCVVTGGTGFIGTVLVERLSQIGMSEIVVPVRGYQTCASVARFPVSLPKVDLMDRAAVRECVKGARWVFHLALGTADAEAFRVTVDGTRILVEEAEAAGVEAVVILSTAWVYGLHAERRVVNELSPFDPAGGSYGKSKAAMQKDSLEHAAKMERTRLVILNPTCVYGPEGKTFTRVPLDLAAQGYFAWVDGGRGTVNHVYVDNLVDAMLFTAAHPGAHGKAWLVSDGSRTWREFLSALLPKPAAEYLDYPAEHFRELAGRSKLRLKQLLRALAGFPPLRRWVRERSLVSWFQKRLSIRPPVPAQAGSAAESAKPEPVPWLLDLFGPAATVVDASALKSLGWIPRVDFPESMKRTREWLAQNQWD